MFAALYAAIDYLLRHVMTLCAAFFHTLHTPLQAAFSAMP